MNSTAVLQLRDEVLAQAASAFLWLVVAFACGIAAFFAWPTDPWPALGAVTSAGATAGLLIHRKFDVFAAVMLAVLAFGLGLTAAQRRVEAVWSPALEHETGPVTIEGRVFDVEREPGRIRVILERVSFSARGVTQMPERVRLSVPAKHGAPRVGDVIITKGMLRPPERPVVPGGFEYQRYLYFERIGALGFTFQQWQVKDADVASSKPHGLRDRLENLRRDISDRILAAVPGDAGAVAVALVTGEQSLISEPLQEAYRVSGLAHLLSISGLHMSMLAAAVFVLVRRLFALWPYIALRLDLKKVAAAAALAATLFYVLISGLSVPAIRAFIMVAVVILAIFVDRRVVSLRSVGLAALALLAIYPEALIGPSFQMSFMAVIGLVALYEQVHIRPVWRDADGELMIVRAALTYVVALAVTDLVAGSVTSLFAAYHFNRMPSYSMVANMIATPITGVWVMPMGLAALALMPLGLDAPLWALMGAGVDSINRLSIWVATWPGAQIHVPPMAIWALSGAALGLLLMCLWRGRLRWLGALPVMIAMVQPWLTQAPDMIIDESGRVLAVADASGRIAMNPSKRDKFVRGVFHSRYGESAQTWPTPGTSNNGLDLSCDAQGCVINRSATSTTIAFSTVAVAEDCGVSNLIIAPNQFVDGCTASVIIDRGNLFREGAHAVYMSNGTVRTESVQALTGQRIWSRQPKPRNRSSVVETTRAEDAAGD